MPDVNRGKNIDDARHRGRWTVSRVPHWNGVLKRNTRARDPREFASLGCGIGFARVHC